MVVQVMVSGSTLSWNVLRQDTELQIPPDAFSGFSFVQNKTKQKKVSVGAVLDVLGVLGEGKK